MVVSPDVMSDANCFPKLETSATFEVKIRANAVIGTASRQGKERQCKTALLLLDSCLANYSLGYLPCPAALYEYNFREPDHS